MSERSPDSRPLEITPVVRPVRGWIRPPGSKSLTNRALIVAALAEGTSHLTGVLDSQDTRVMVESLRRLGLSLEQDVDARTLTITGCGGRPAVSGAELFLENSGTSIRFLTALCALGRGRFRLDGNARMRERPIQDLVVGLRGLGVDIRCESDSGCPPVIVEATGLQGGETTVAGNVSSQFLSGLLMATPGAERATTVRVTGSLVSEPYVDMTLAVMRSFGVSAKRHSEGGTRFVVPTGRYRATDYDIEPDASAASYFFALAAVTQGEITVEGLTRDALQGDVKFVEALERMGCLARYGEKSITVIGRPLRGIEIDMHHISDTAQTLACVAPFAEGPTRIVNVANMRVKETDRIAAVTAELRKAGQRVDEFADGFEIHPAPVRPALIETYDDHRMAMSFSVLGLRAEGIRIANPECTVKTYPGYFDDINALCRRAREGAGHVEFSVDRDPPPPDR
jgi:3-phosphoshikimate 1-carboxyvinyltransferase